MCGACLPSDQLERLVEYRILLKVQSGGIAAAIQPADRFSSSSSAVALECSFDMAEIMLTLEADCGLGAALCFAACSMSESVARLGSFRVEAVELDPEDVADVGAALATVGDADTRWNASFSCPLSTSILNLKSMPADAMRSTWASSWRMICVTSEVSFSAMLRSVMGISC